MAKNASSTRQSVPLPQKSFTLCATVVLAYAGPNNHKEEPFPSGLAARLLAGESPIRVLRACRGLTQEQPAKSAKTARARLAEIEGGRKVDSVSVLRAITVARKSDLDDIAG